MKTLLNSLVTSSLVTTSMVLLGGLQIVQAATITSAHSGAWFDPTRNGQGFQVQIIGNSQKEVLLYWYTFDNAGNPMWLFAQGPVLSDRVRMEALEARGPRFMQNGAPLSLRSIGQIELSFSDCNRGELRYETTFGSGAVPLTRLSNTFGVQCTGTAIDDRNPTQTRSDDLQSVQGGLTIKKRLREEPGRIRLNIELEGPNSLVGRTLGLWVEGRQRATLTLQNSPSGARAEVEFAAPVEVGKLPLDFDARTQVIEIRDSSGNLVDVGTGTTTGTLPPFGNRITTRALVMNPGFSLGSGEAELKQEPQQVSFEVELEDVPIGAYILRIGGIVRGSLLVSMSGNRAKGKLEFASPLDNGKLLMNFDPRGQIIELLSGGSVVASVLFPNV